MSRRFVVAAAFVTIFGGAPLAPAPAAAFQTAGRFGLGYDADLNGINVRYFFSRLGLDMTVGFALATATADGQKTKFDLIFAPKLVYALELHETVNLNVLGGMFLQVLGSHARDQTDMNIGFFGGLAPELIIWDHLAVEVFFGLSANINNLLEKQAGKTNFTFGTLGRRLSVVSGAVFRWYF
jgi:hypothetical protein